MIKFGTTHFFWRSLIVCMGIIINLTTSAAAIRVTAFGEQIPALISNSVELGSAVKGITPLITQLQSAISPDSIKVFTNTIDAYAKKDYEHLAFANIGNFFETSVPPAMNALLALYPSIRLAVNHVGAPIINLLYDLGGITGSALAKNFCGNLKTLIESGIIERTFSALNDLDNLLENGLLPRISALFTELDGLVEGAKLLGTKI